MYDMSYRGRFAEPKVLHISSNRSLIANHFFSCSLMLEVNRTRLVFSLFLAFLVEYAAHIIDNTRGTQCSYSSAMMYLSMTMRSHCATRPRRLDELHMECFIELHYRVLEKATLKKSAPEHQ